MQDCFAEMPLGVTEAPWAKTMEHDQPVTTKNIATISSGDSVRIDRMSAAKPSRYRGTTST